MNQITSMFTESNNRMKQIMKGEFKLEQVSAAQREFEGQIKLINAIISAFGIASKNKRALTSLDRMNIMDDNTAVDLGLGVKEEDKIKCPLNEGIITKGECLDFSGTQREEFCNSCDIGGEAKKVLLAPKLQL